MRPAAARVNAAPGARASLIAGVQLRSASLARLATLAAGQQ